MNWMLSPGMLGLGLGFGLKTTFLVLALKVLALALCGLAWPTHYHLVNCNFLSSNS